MNVSSPKSSGLRVTVVGLELEPDAVPTAQPEAAVGSLQERIRALEVRRADQVVGEGDVCGDSGHRGRGERDL